VRDPTPLNLQKCGMLAAENQVLALCDQHQDPDEM
jgi:hypothetical protein